MLILFINDSISAERSATNVVSLWFSNTQRSPHRVQTVCRIKASLLLSYAKRSANTHVLVAPVPVINQYPIALQLYYCLFMRRSYCVILRWASFACRVTFLLKRTHTHAENRIFLLLVRYAYFWSFFVTWFFAFDWCYATSLSLFFGTTNYSGVLMSDYEVVGVIGVTLGAACKTISACLEILCNKLLYLQIKINGRNNGVFTNSIGLPQTNMLFPQNQCTNRISPSSFQCNWDRSIVLSANKITATAIIVQQPAYKCIGQNICV